MHEHKFQGQTLRHEHDGDQSPHGYFEHPEDIKAAVPVIGYSAVSAGPWHSPYSTAADHAAYAAARMNAAGGMDDAEAVADGNALVIEVHQVPVYRAEFRCTVVGCTQCDEHPQTEIEDMPPVAEALAEVDRRQNTSGQNGELTALRVLAEAVRVDLMRRAAQS
jgi:hypothetical protein